MTSHLSVRQLAQRSPDLASNVRKRLIRLHAGGDLSMIDFLALRKYAVLPEGTEFSRGMNWEDVKPLLKR
jgi:hypothetical protein